MNEMTMNRRVDDRLVQKVIAAVMITMTVVETHL
jgi:hypothetical protein